ncbi:MAG: hypothetical protein ABEL76_00820, partial [Bradymonadaceae bacterium]
PETLAGQVDTSALRKLAETQIRTGGKYDVSKEAKPLSGAQREANLEWAYRLARQLRSTGDGQSIDGDLIGRALGRLADTPGSVTKLLEKHHSLGSSLSAEGYKSLLTTLRARGVQADVESLVAQCRKVTGSKTACEQLEKVENSDAGKSKEVTSEDVDRANKKLEGMDF